VLLQEKRTRRSGPQAGVASESRCAELLRFRRDRLFALCLYFVTVATGFNELSSPLQQSWVS
jgi:hypothetical protein